MKKHTISAEKKYCEEDAINTILLLYSIQRCSKYKQNKVIKCYFRKRKIKEFIKFLYENRKDIIFVISMFAVAMGLYILLIQLMG